MKKGREEMKSGKTEDRSALRKQRDLPVCLFLMDSMPKNVIVELTGTGVGAM